MAALLQLLYKFILISIGYICLVLRQNGGAGVSEGEEGRIPQYLNIFLWTNIRHSSIRWEDDRKHAFRKGRIPILGQLRRKI